MSYSQKRKGFRNIVVDGARYRWCLRTGADANRVILQSEMSGGQQAIVVMRNSRDPWLDISDGRAELIKISPKIVRTMIQQALTAGWQPAHQQQALQIDFHPPS